MIGLILIYFIGKQYYELAIAFDKHKWGYPILGVVAYYGGTFIFGTAFFVILELGGFANVNEFGELEVSFMSLPFGVLTCWAVYKLLKRNWS